MMEEIFKSQNNSNEKKTKTTNLSLQVQSVMCTPAHQTPGTFFSAAGSVFLGGVVDMRSVDGSALRLRGFSSRDYHLMVQSPHTSTVPWIPDNVPRSKLLRTCFRAGKPFQMNCSSCVYKETRSFVYFYMSVMGSLNTYCFPHDVMES